jgi:hypothetical protein
VFSWAEGTVHTTLNRTTVHAYHYVNYTIYMQAKQFPWLKAVASPAIWAVIVTHSCSTWVFYVSQTTFPMYMKEVLKFDIRQVGITADASRSRSHLRVAATY